MDQTVSVIVPIYKVEKYLQTCLDSILAQTYEDLEIILVDDGSPDRCPQICDAYAEKDARIRVIHKKNGGLSDARNAGMALATGAFLMFVDSDDWIEPDAVSALHDQLIAHDAQMAIGCMRQIADETGEVLLTTYHPDGVTECFPKRAIMEEALRGGGWGSWARLYRMDIHKDLLFPFGEINEDEAIALRLIDRCERIVKVHTLVYNYRIRKNSICTSSFSEAQLHWYKHCKEDLEWVRLHHPELETMAQHKLFLCTLVHLSEIALASKELRHLAAPLLQTVRDDHHAFIAYAKQTGKPLWRIWMYRYLPYSFYCSIAKAWWQLRHK